MARGKTKAKSGARSKPRPRRAKARTATVQRTATAKTAKRAGKRPAKRAATTRRAAGGGRNDAMRALAQRIIDVTIADQDDAILALYADDIASTEAGQPPMVGLDALRGKLAGWRSMVTETHFEPRRVAVDGNVIVIEWVGRVTLAASGRQAELHEVAVHEIRDGKIAREAFFYNPAALA